VFLGLLIIVGGVAVALKDPIQVYDRYSSYLVYPYATLGGLVMLIGFVCFVAGCAIPSKPSKSRRQVEREILREFQEAEKEEEEGTED